MSVTSHLDAFQRRHPAAGFPIAVLYKYFDDQGSYLAALIAYYGFVSLFPLLLLLSTILGLVLKGHPHLQEQVLNSALGQFPVIGHDLRAPGRLGGGASGIIIGVLGALYGGLGVAQAIQNAMNVAWAVPRNHRPNPFKARARSLVLIATAGLGVLGTAVLTGFANNAQGLGTAVSVAFILASIAVNAAIFTVAFLVATTRRLGVRDVLPGAIGAAVLWQALQSFGTIYVRHVVNGSSATNSTFAVVLGLIAFLFLAASAVVLCVEVNVVRKDHLHPRALLTPFTDDVYLTHGDRRAYTGQAQAQRTKGFEQIDVSFDPPADQAPEADRSPDRPA